MLLLAAGVAALSLVLPAFGTPTKLLDIVKYDGETTGRHVVVLNNGITPTSFLEATNITAIHKLGIINGFAGELGDTVLETLRAHPDVESIHEDPVYYTDGSQNDSPWGLCRLSQQAAIASGNDPSGLYYNFYYDAYGGEEVDIYVIDTGVYVDHLDFRGRARWGTSFGWPQVDPTGHGTHVA
ncbi:hypothetical protein H0H87_008657, partial [Tephrocybe sp. NHM501043]